MDMVVVMVVIVKLRLRRQGVSMAVAVIVGVMCVVVIMIQERGGRARIHLEGPVQGTESRGRPGSGVRMSMAMVIVRLRHCRS